MRLWSIHPKYLDRQGLLACWREGLLALSVARKGFVGAYSNHPQLERFKKTADPEKAIARFVFGVSKEMKARGYKPKAILAPMSMRKIPVTTGQLSFEFVHLQRKLAKRSRKKFLENSKAAVEKKTPSANPVFVAVKGKMESWEKTRPRQGTIKRA